MDAFLSLAKAIALLYLSWYYLANFVRDRSAVGHHRNRRDHQIFYRSRHSAMPGE